MKTVIVPIDRIVAIGMRMAALFTCLQDGKVAVSASAGVMQNTSQC